MAVRYFSPAEANALLPRVRPLAERLVAARADQLAAHAELAELAARVGGNGGGIDSARSVRLARVAAEAEERVRTALDALQRLGVVVKDLDSGLVDFPAQRGGAEVFLCWRLGEEAVAYWHGLEEGFAGRKPL
jgi:hypothetical protein